MWGSHNLELLGLAHGFLRRKVASLLEILTLVQYLAIDRAVFRDLPTIIEEVCQRRFYVKWMHASQSD
jgi:hypothetical protein